MKPYNNLQNNISSSTRFTNYDVSSYTDSELLNILSLTNPTDRELEARIIQMIQRSNIGEPTSDRYQKFFMDIYKRFFDVDSDSEAEEADTIQEGMTDNAVVESFVSNQEEGDGEEAEAEASDDANPNRIDDRVALTRPLDYSKDQMNPLLKQVVRRTVSVDSQYRNRQFHKLSTSFSFNLSEPLRDVVSLKLYSIQIPYSWYTVGNVYGSNLIYFKGNSPGIDNGEYDYSVGVPAGNYDQTGLIDTINSSKNDLINERLDVSFGSSNYFSYNNSSILTTANVYINNTFNESTYSLSFTDPGYVNRSQVVNGNTVINNIDRYGYKDANNQISGKLNAFLGFNNATYNVESFYSARTFSGVLDNIYSTININSTNNIIRIVQYKYTDISAGNYYVPDNSLNEVEVVIKPGQYTEQTLFDQINRDISSNTYLDTSVSGLSIIPITNPDMDNTGNSYFQFTFRILRNSPAFISGNPSVRTAVILPSDTSIWIGQTSIFKFDLSLNEINIIKAETNSIENGYNSNTSQYFVLKCTRPGYTNSIDPSTYVDVPYNVSNLSFFRNDIKVGLSPNYASTLTTFVSSINSSIAYTNGVSQSLNQISSNGVFNNSTTRAYIDPQNVFKIDFDMNNMFTNPSYCVTFGNMIDNSFPFVDISLNSYTDNSSTSTKSTFISNSVEGKSRTIGSQTEGGTIIPALILTVFPNANSYNAGDISWNVYLYSSDELYETATNIQNAITSFYYTLPNGGNFYPMKNSTVTFDINTFQYTVNISIQNILSQNDYELRFYDGSADALWNQLILKSYTTTSYSYVLDTGASISTIAGDSAIPGKSFNLFETTSFTLNCIYGAVCPENNFTITIPGSTVPYTRTTLLNAMNDQLTSNPVTYGSRFYIYYNPVINKEYIYLKLNIAKVYTVADYRLVFYDVVSFVKCYVGASSVRNTSWDATLGWTLGYRNTEYDLSQYMSTSGTTAIVSSETALNIYPYNYFYIILDDYNQSRLNDGLITVSLSENIISQPSYAPKQSFYCDSSGNKVFIGSDSQPLTSNQIWSANQIYLDSKTVKSIYSTTPFIKDVFGIIPIKPGSAGSNYVEFGGSLQNQERLYFGPVTIHRMSIQLIDDKGDVVDLNGSEWSFSFICEQLYRSDAGSS